MKWFTRKNKSKPTPNHNQDQNQDQEIDQNQDPEPNTTELAGTQPSPEPEYHEDSTRDADPQPDSADITAENEEPLSDTKHSDTSQRKGFFSRLKRGLAKTRQILTTDIEDLFAGKQVIDDDMLEEIEELLITSDIGVQTAMDIMETVNRKSSKIKGPEDLKQVIKEEILSLLNTSIATKAPMPSSKPHVVMVVGVNGVGKTTTIGKLAARKIDRGEKVLIAAADTFRAAAIEQLTIWAERAGADIVKHKDNADPAAVAYDSMEAAIARDVDTVFVDTAGRLHTKVNLMEELKKIKRTISKKIPDAPHEILLVLDATTGQNALSQAKLFDESMDLSGLILTKLDGTAKGGIVVSICQQLNLPLQYIGVGESAEDLQPFDAQQFVEALF